MRTLPRRVVDLLHWFSNFLMLVAIFILFSHSGFARRISLKCRWEFRVCSPWCWPNDLGAARCFHFRSFPWNVGQFAYAPRLCFFSCFFSACFSTMSTIAVKRKFDVLSQCRKLPLRFWPSLSWHSSPPLRLHQSCWSSSWIWLNERLFFDLLGFCFSHLSELFMHFLLCFGNHSSNHLCAVSSCICSLCCPSILSLLHLYLIHQSSSTSCVILRVIWMHGHAHCNWLHSSAIVHSTEHSAQDIGSHSYSSNFFCGGFRVLSPKKNRKNNTVWIHVGLWTRPNIQVFLKFILYPRLYNFLKLQIIILFMIVFGYCYLPLNQIDIFSGLIIDL